MQVGWIGLGQMGAPMALRVAGVHPLVAHARRPLEHDGLSQAGARLTPSVIEAARDADVLCACLFDDHQVHDALIAQGALTAMRPGGVLALLSTGSPDLMAELKGRAPDQVTILDVPFSGTASIAAQGGLTLLVGGDPRGLERARPVLATFASTIIQVGDLGAGRKLKLINNLLFAAQVSLAAEALAAIEGLGLDGPTGVKALGHCSAASYAMAKFADVDPDHLLAALKPYLDKDVDAAREALDGAKIDLPLLRAAAQWGTR